MRYFNASTVGFSCVGCYELSRQYRRKGNGEALRSLLTAAMEAGVELKEDFVGEAREWLEKRGLEMP